MVRRLSPGALLVASHNRGKITEFARAFGPLGLEVISAADRDLPEPEETGNTFEANALLKARAAAEATGTLALADDSGLAVDALDGAPGIYSARWAGPGKDFAPAFARIDEELTTRGQAGADGAAAAFVCVLALVWPDGESVTAEGRVIGRLTLPPRGEGGFGYDPIFVPEGESRTFAEMTSDEKAQHSHRMRALDALLARVAP